MSEIELKPCPFCGGKAMTYIAVIRRNIADCIRYAVYCPACQIEQHNDMEETGSIFETAEATMQKAIEAWNRRTESVRHGKWEFKVIDGFVPDYDCVCSECGENGVPDNRYCRNCGAKMEGEGWLFE